MAQAIGKSDNYDVAVIGAGFGGIAAALELARRGARVALFEALKYPGGCASTFVRQGRRYESGATLFSGFGDGQLFRRWIDELSLDVVFEELDPVVELRTSTFDLSIPGRRDELVRRVGALPGADRPAVERFFAHQRQVADLLWELFDDPTLIPPFGSAELLRHVARTPRYLALLRWVGQPLRSVLEKHGVQGFEPLRTYLNAVSQITVQAGVDEAEAPFALAAMDYYFRGTGHVRGGIGELASALVGAIERAGGDVFMADGVTELTRDAGAWNIISRRRAVRAETVVANLLPTAVQRLVGRSSPRLDAIAEGVSTGWGAAMLYLSVDDAAVPWAEPHHLELVADNGEPFIEGNHVFVSIGGRDEAGRAPAGQRTVTVSTHVRMDQPDTPNYVDGVHARMRETLARRAPELVSGAVLEMTASPRTFERFTQRPMGYVGGIPRRAGLHNYRNLLPAPVLDGLYLVGDSVFPGQSTLATAIGGVKVAGAIAAG